MKKIVNEHKDHLLSGVSYAIPFIACGGILTALAIGLAPMGVSGPDFELHAGYTQFQAMKVSLLKYAKEIGSISFSLVLPVLAGYISHAMSGKNGLVSGFIGGYMANEFHAGFLGALLAGFFAGHLVRQINKVSVHKYLEPVMPILVIPILSSLVVGGIMFWVCGPIADLMASLQRMLEGMQGTSVLVLGVVLGAMIAFDMGGPVNKAAFFFAATLLERGNYQIMGAISAAICTPPLGMGLATLIRGKLWSQQERQNGIASLSLGMIGITEGAIPFAAAEPLRVIPCIMFGSMIASGMAMLGGVGNHAPHGGPIVLLVIDNRLMYIGAIVTGTVVTALAINAVRGYSAKKNFVQ